jgi:hypothetical protein
MVRKLRSAAVVVTAVASLVAGAAVGAGAGMTTAGPGDHWCC